jgi:cytochrome c oxidase subunit 2
VSAAAAVALGAGPSLLDPHGPEAHRIAGIWWLMFGLAAAVYLVVGGFILAGALRGRRTESGKDSRISERAFIWIGGIIVPTAILGVLAVVTVQGTTHLRQPERNPLKVEVVGKRWWWEVRYPSLHFTTANEIHIPVGRPIEVGLDSDNVIHSFWVPQLAGKLDTIPGQHNVLRLKADKPGTYRGVCAEYCGTQHARMQFVVIADSTATFDRWAARRQRPPAPPESDVAAAGELAFVRSPCAGCHTIKGTQADGKLGPDLTDFGARHWIGSITVPNTADNLAGWITDPESIKPGSLMPPTALSPDDLRSIVAYLEGLK